MARPRYAPSDDLDVAVGETVVLVSGSVSNAARFWAADVPPSTAFRRVLMQEEVNWRPNRHIRFVADLGHFIFRCSKRGGGNLFGRIERCRIDSGYFLF